MLGSRHAGRMADGVRHIFGVYVTGVLLSMSEHFKHLESLWSPQQRPVVASILVFRVHWILKGVFSTCTHNM